MKRQEVGDVVEVPKEAVTAAAADDRCQEEDSSEETEDEAAAETLLNVTETNKRLADKRDQQIREEVVKIFSFHLLISIVYVYSVHSDVSCKSLVDF